ncbi:MAG: hypothetical protein JWN50_341 [Parcubacteria group bacterium]|nr:hypothetical protein [Parcubacteria group bacterium]
MGILVLMLSSLVVPKMASAWSPNSLLASVLGSVTSLFKPQPKLFSPQAQPAPAVTPAGTSSGAGVIQTVDTDKLKADITASLTANLRPDLFSYVRSTVQSAVQNALQGIAPSTVVPLPASPIDLDTIKADVYASITNRLSKQNDSGASSLANALSGLANGGTFATPTLSGTTLSDVTNSLLKTNGNGLIVSAVAGTDYVATTTGNWLGTISGLSPASIIAGGFSTTSAAYFLSIKTTDNLTQGAVNKYYNSSLFNTDFAAKTTDGLTQGTTNRYYATSLFNTDFAAKTSDNLTQGATNKYWSQSLFDIALSATTTLNNITTLKGLTDIIATRSTTTNATSTTFFATTASSTNLLTSLFNAGSNALVVNAAGIVGIGRTDATSGKGVFNVTYPFARTDTSQRNILSLTSNDSISSTWSLLFTSTGGSSGFSRNFGIQSMDGSSAFEGNIAFQKDGGTVSIGDTTGDGGTPLYVSRSFTAGSGNAANIISSVTTSSNSVSTVGGLSVSTRWNQQGSGNGGTAIGADITAVGDPSTGGTIFDVSGIRGNAFILDPGTTSEVYGGNFIASESGEAHITRAAAVHTQNSFVGGSSGASVIGVNSGVFIDTPLLSPDSSFPITITSNYGLYVGSQADVGTTNYGIYIANQNGSGTNYAIYSTSGTNFFNGNVGIGITNPTHALQLASNDAAKPTSNTWTIISDKRLKQNIQTFSDGLAVLNQINPVSYELNGKAGTPYGAKGIGILAQDVKDIIPYTIDTFQAKLNPGDATDTTLYDFNSSALTFVLINGVKELSIAASSTNSRIDALASRVSVLESSSSTQTITDSSGIWADFSYMGIEIARGIATFGDIIANSITAKHAVFDDIQLKDVDTGSPYCVRVKSGVLIQTPGTCESSASSFAPPASSGGSDTGTPADNTASSTPPNDTASSTPPVEDASSTPSTP